MIDPRQQLVEQQKVRLDWRAYWKEFSREHGDYPVKFRGVLLFRDGWTYSSSDYAGPEWPPPADETALRKLVRGYWLLRKREVRKLWWEQQTEYDGLKRLQSTRSQPLQHSSVWLVHDESGTPKRQRYEGPVDFVMMEQEVARLREQLDECERMLLECQQATETARSA